MSVYILEHSCNREFKQFFNKMCMRNMYVCMCACVLGGCVEMEQSTPMTITSVSLWLGLVTCSMMPCTPGKTAHYNDDYSIGF